jgi:actin-related protein
MDNNDNNDDDDDEMNNNEEKDFKNKIKMKKNKNKNLFSMVEQAVLFDSILICGGSTKFKQLNHRLFNDLSMCKPVEYPSLTIHETIDPIGSCWRGASAFAFNETDLLLKQYTVTRSEYEEFGESICFDRFTL